jgi:hypothetical protein
VPAAEETLMWELAAALITITATTLGAVLMLWVRLEHRLTVLEERLKAHEELHHRPMGRIRPA